MTPGYVSVYLAMSVFPFFPIPGNGVVIHLPGLFDEAEKNLQKGKGKIVHQSNISIQSNLPAILG